MKNLWLEKIIHQPIYKGTKICLVYMLQYIKGFFDNTVQSGFQITYLPLNKISLCIRQRVGYIARRDSIFWCVFDIFFFASNKKIALKLPL